MMHWVSRRLPASEPVEVAFPRVNDLTPLRVSGRSEHARMMAHAATRRRRASGDAERAYWKACAPAAVARATQVRLETGFARLP